MTWQTVIFIQGIYYFFTGVWPLVHLRSFEKITGDKKEHWLLYAVSLMITCSSLVFLVASLRRGPLPIEVLTLSISNVVVLSFIDIYFCLKGIIRKIYLIDALIELFILAGVLVVCGL